MNKKLVIAFWLGFSLFAGAQSMTNKQTAKTAVQIETPRDGASGQTSGQLEQHKVVHRDIAAREAASGHASGKAAAQGTQSSTGVPTSSSAATKSPATSSGATAQTHVAAGDVNGDGAASVSAGKNSAHATESTSATSQPQMPRDAQSGMATGKRQHQPMTPAKSNPKGSTPNQ